MKKIVTFKGKVSVIFLSFLLAFFVRSWLTSQRMDSVPQTKHQEFIYAIDGKLLATSEGPTISDVLETFLRESPTKARVDPEDPWFAALRSFPEEKQVGLKSILEHYSAQRRVVGEAFEMGSERLQALIDLENAERSDIGDLLSPEELETYDLLFSTCAQQLRDKASHIGLASEEIVSLFRLHRKREEDIKLLSALPAENRKMLLRELSVGYDHALVTALGEERYAEFKLLDDHTYRHLADVRKEFDLDKRAVAAAYGARNEAIIAAKAVLEHPGLDASVRLHQSIGIRLQTEQDFRRILGDTAAAAFFARSGDWFEIPY